MVAHDKTRRQCKLPSCQNTAYKLRDGVFSNYCSLRHRDAAKVCLYCYKAHKKFGHFCSKQCANGAERNGPAILAVPEWHATFQNVSDQFEKSWKHPPTTKSQPRVRRVYKIISTQESLEQYTSYRDAVEKQGQFKSRGRSPGNENRRWHGTRRECNLGNDENHEYFCSSETCSLCRIIVSSYKMSHCGMATHWGRFGAGIYTSSTSSKSDDYSHNVCSSNLKAVLLNKVVVGNGCKLVKNNTSLNAPPAGYHSVLGEIGGSLNYDELVVYTADAIRPSFLVLYDA